MAVLRQTKLRQGLRLSLRQWNRLLSRFDHQHGTEQIFESLVSGAQILRMLPTLEIIVILLVLSSYRSAANVKRNLDNYVMTMWTMWTILFRYSKKTFATTRKITSVI